MPALMMTPYQKEFRMSQYQVAIVDLKAKHLVGMNVHSNMHKAQHDCPALWQSFGPRMGELLAMGADCSGSYGVSFMLNAEEFVYWAAMETDPAAVVPADMGSIDIPAGQYAKCAVPNLEKLGDAYKHLYGTWPQSQSDYTYREQSPCFEFYSPNWDPAQPLEIYMPLMRKA